MLSLFLLLSAEPIHAQEDAARYLESVEKAYADLKDYTCSVNVHFDMEALKAPDMQATVYYKAPDKMKVESKKIFFLPREGGLFNPAMFKPEDFDIIFLERLSYDGRKAVRLKLIPKKMRGMNQEFILTIDTERNLIRDMNISQPGGKVIKASINYASFDRFELPTRVELQIDIPPVEPNGMREFDQFAPRGRRITGRVEISYSNYRVNSGLSNEIFKETESRKPK